MFPDYENAKKIVLFELNGKTCVKAIMDDGLGSIIDDFSKYNVETQMYGGETGVEISNLTGSLEIYENAIKHFAFLYPDKLFVVDGGEEKKWQIAKTWL